MRPNVVAGILFFASGILGVIFLISQAVNHEVNGKTGLNAPVAQQEPDPPSANQSPGSELVVVSCGSPPAVVPSVQEADSETSSSERVAELMALAENDDSNSLHTICSELTNPDRETRTGALAAVVQFGDRSVVPCLRQLAEQTSDPFEKADITKAADQLALPLLGESDQSKPGNEQQNGQR
jgi:hypothetical protein